MPINRVIENSTGAQSPDSISEPASENAEHNEIDADSGLARNSEHNESDAESRSARNSGHWQTTSPEGTLCEMMVYVHRFNKRGEQVVVPSIEDPGEEQEAKRDTEHALVYRKFFNVKQQLVDTRVDIYSPQILQALSAVVQYFPQQPASFLEAPIQISGPFKLLYQHWDELVEFQKNSEDAEMKMHLKFLLKFMDREMKDDRKKANKLASSGFINFSFLWTLFKSGDLILSGSDNRQELFRLEYCYYDQDNKGRFLRLVLSYTDYDGKLTGWAVKSPSIYEAVMGDGETVDIRSLDYYPLSFAKNPEDIQRALAERGERFLSLRGMHVQRYDGLLDVLKRPPWSYYSHDYRHYAGTFKEMTTRGRVAVDASTFYAENAYYIPKISLEKSTPEGEGRQRQTVRFWPAVEPLLCPAYVRGYSFTLKEWCNLWISQLSEPEWIPNSFEKLILPDAPKQVIKALVNSHKFPEGGARDQQDLKGKGLVILLHGEPGTGKTLTAETVSEYTKRPLLVISSGELGSEPSDIDKNLTSFLQYAAQWKAIVLIDECDVFVEKRQSGSGSRLEHNSLVAVFLRQLEYFQGIVFLTSNRYENLDPAIKSRIHLFLGYSDPDENVRTTLWKQKIETIDPGMIDFETEEALRLVARLAMNGREISNAIHTIQTLAREADKKITLQEFHTYVQVWECFSNVSEIGKGKISQDGGKIRRADSFQVQCEHCGCSCQKFPLSRQNSFNPYR